MPTQSMAEGLAALIVYDPRRRAQITVREMAEAATSVTTGEVTQAVRDTSVRSARFVRMTG